MNRELPWSAAANKVQEMNWRLTGAWRGTQCAFPVDGRSRARVVNPPMKAALCLIASLLIVIAHAAEKSPQGNTWDSIKQLPDWSGVWGLDDASFAKTVAASSAPDGNPNIPPLT